MELKEGHGSCSLAYRKAVCAHSAVSDSLGPHGLKAWAPLSWSFPRRRLEWVAVSFSRGPFQPEELNLHLLCQQADSLLLSQELMLCLKGNGKKISKGNGGQRPPCLGRPRGPCLASVPPKTPNSPVVLGEKLVGKFEVRAADVVLSSLWLVVR